MDAATKRVRILIADDHTAVRRSIRSLLESSSQWEVCGEARTGLEAVEQSRALKPDIVLLDVTMPELNGLEAARRILGERPETRVVLLIMHPSDELTEEARRIGVESLVLKSDAHLLTAAIHALAPAGAAIHLAGSEVNRARHVAAFFSSDAERYGVIAPFVHEGLTAGEKAFHIIDGAGREKHIRRLMEAGIEVDRATSAGQMEIVPWEAMYLSPGDFDQDAMLMRIQEVLRNTTTQGFPLTRVVANMECALVPPLSIPDLVEYESRLNDVLPAFNDVVICAYDLAKFEAGVIIDVLRGHPAVIVGGSLHENPFYVAPEQLLHQLRQRRTDIATP